MKYLIYRVLVLSFFVLAVNACKKTNEQNTINSKESITPKLQKVFINGDSDLRNKMILQINQKGVPCYSGSCSEVYLEKAFENTSFRPKERLSIAKELGETSLVFLVHPSLTEKEISKTCEVLIEVASKYSAD